MTIPGTPNMSKQEIFDTVARHLLTQKKACQNDGGACRYRAGDLKCAVGALIPDDLYTSTIEGTTPMLPDDVAEASPKIRKLQTLLWSILPVEPTLKMARLLVGLQQVHDGWNPCFWRDQLKEVANGHSINNEVLDDF